MNELSAEGSQPRLIISHEIILFKKLLSFSFTTVIGFAVRISYDVCLVACFLALRHAMIIAWSWLITFFNNVCIYVFCRSVWFGGPLYLLFILRRSTSTIWYRCRCVGLGCRLFAFGSKDFCNQLVFLFAWVWALTTLLSFDAHVIFLSVASNLRTVASSNMLLNRSPISFE